MTEKLYYKDSYISEFSARVVSVTEVSDGYDIVLDKTAFFPEEGGQSADSGYIGELKVKYVYEKDGVVYHKTDAVPERDTVFCKIDFNERFDKMQQHTAEHILSGVIHSLFGYENVGFHLGDDVVTFDIDHPLTREELDRVEDLANEAVFRNLKVEAFFPTKKELENETYRSKLDLTENVRLVKIGDVDSCACCAPHVNYTGEIGLIKCLDFMHHRGGVRITMCAGGRALKDYREKYRNIREISAILSEPQHTTAEALNKYVSDKEKQKLELKTIKRVYAESLADNVSSDGNLVIILDHVGMDELRDFANKAVKHVKGILVALIGSDNDYKYVMASSSVDLRVKAKDINEKLSGRGGGHPQMIQGSLFTDIKTIKKYFEC